MNRGLKIIAIAASVLIAVIVISIYYGLYRKGVAGNNEMYSKSQAVMSAIDYSSLARYDNKIIYGSEVKYLLNEDGPTYELSTAKYAAVHPDDEYFSDFSQINDATGITYVDQSALFEVSTILNENEVIVGLRFKEVKE